MVPEIIKETRLVANGRTGSADVALVSPKSTHTLNGTRNRPFLEEPHGSTSEVQGQDVQPGRPAAEARRRRPRFRVRQRPGYRPPQRYAQGRALLQRGAVARYARVQSADQA